MTNSEYLMLEFYDSGYYVGHSPETYDMLIDIALDTNDKIWFYILVNKKKRLMDYINKYV